jgi:hypothetical protein
MTKIEIEQTLVKETQDLSDEALQEILDFIHFIKMKELREPPKYVSNSDHIHDELRALNDYSLAHLEEEFANYKTLYPHES